MTDLPELYGENLRPTRDYLRDVALALGSFQRAFLEPHQRLWQYGLEVTMRGISTQAVPINDEEVRVSLDLVRRKVRLGDIAWSLHEYGGVEVYNNLKVWLETRRVRAELEQPEFSGSSQFNSEQATSYAEALWWLDKRLRVLEAEIKDGVTSPVLLYPHNFDLSLSWFPHDDDRQVSIGFSAGDESVYEPYLYLTAYPEPNNFKTLKLPKESIWQEKGFSGAVLPYATLAGSNNPDQTFVDFAELFKSAGKLFT